MDGKPVKPGGRESGLPKRDRRKHENPSTVLL
jgi:hypothetical protein